MIHRRAIAGLLGIDAGGTRTVGLLASPSGQMLSRKEWGPGNLRLLDDRKLLRHFQRIAEEFPRPSAVAIGMAGVRLPTDRARVTTVLNRLWAGVPQIATHDLDAAWWAAQAGVNAAAPSIPRVIVLSGTGSCCYGRTSTGETSKVGGWGHQLGDRGSGYEIGLLGLKAVVEAFDRGRRWPRLGARLLRALQLNSPEEFIDWVKGAEKSQVAELAIAVFAAWREGDPVAREVVTTAAGGLVEDAVACARQLATSNSKVEFRLAGGVLLKEARFAALVKRQIQRRWPNSSISPLTRESAWGAVELARQALAANTTRVAAEVTRRSIPRHSPGNPPPYVGGYAQFVPQTEGSSPTEQSNAN